MTALTATLPTEVLLDPMRSAPAWLKSSLDNLNITDPRHPTIPERAAPTVDQRRDLAATLSHLRSLLAPAAPAEVATCIAIVRAGLRSKQSDETSESAGAEVFMMVLQGLPAFALREAARRIVMGDAGLSLIFVPTAAEMRHVAVSLMANAKWHAKRLELLLGAEVQREISDEERERVAARFSALSRGALGADGRVTDAA